MHLLFLALLVVTILAPTGSRAAKFEPCPGGRYLVDGDVLVPGAPIVVDIVDVGTTVEIASGCGPVATKLKGKRKGTKFKAKFTTCTGLEGKVRLAATIDTTCTTMTGTLRGKKAKLKREFTATLDTNNPPDGAFTAAATVVAGTPLAFVATATDPDGDPLTLYWRFGDGGFGGGGEIAHVFATNGSFDVVLTVADGRGGTDTAQQTIEVTPGPQPTGAVTAAGSVKTTGGAPLAGVGVVVVGGGGSGTTDANGKVSVSVPIGSPGTLRLTKGGYADQIVVVDAPAGAESAIFQAEMMAREAPLTLASALAGGTLSGKDGASITVPAGALVDGSGTPVAGAVQVSMSPVDPTADPDAFPGVYAGVTPAAEQGLLLSYGTVEYALSQGGQGVNLAPGTKATIEIPAYADALADGTLIGAGSTIPLWSLDERTGQWVQEGIGTIVVSAASPTGWSLRGEVTHFSWWNCDAFSAPAYKPKPRCLVDTNHDGILEDLTGTGYCWHYGTGPEQPSGGFGAGRPRGVVRRLPQYAAEVMLPPSGGVILPVPADYEIVLRSTAKAGTLAATTILSGPGDLEEEIQVVLEEIDPSAAVPITVPWDQTYTIDAAAEVDSYVFTATASAPIYVTVSRASGSLSGSVFVDGPDPLEFGPAPFTSASGEIGFIAPVSGEYRISVEGTSGAPGSYRLQVQPTGTFPLVVSTNPSDGATGVSAATAIAVTFTTPIDPATVTIDTFRVDGGGLAVSGTRDVVGSVITFTPDVSLGVGSPHTVTLTTGIRTLGGVALPSQQTFGFSTADVLGLPAYLGAGSRPSMAPLPGNEALVVFQGGSADALATRYVPGQGWSPSVMLSTGETYIGTRAASNAAGDAIALWRQTDPVPPSARSVWAARYTQAGGWSPATVIEDLTESLTGFGNGSGDFQGFELALDAAGNAIAVFSESTLRYWSNRYTAAVGWGTPELLSNPAGPGGGVSGSGLAMNDAGEAMFVSAELPVGGTVDILARRYTPSGGWEAPVPLEGSPAGIFDPRVAIDADGNAIALWRQSGAYVARRYDAGDAMWSPTTVTIETDTSGSSLAADDDAEIVFAADGRAVAVGHAFAGAHVVWAAEYAPGPGGTEGTWTTGIVLDPVWAAGGPNFDLNSNGDGIAVWAAQPGSEETRYKRYLAGVGWDANYTVLPGFTDTDQRPWALATEGGALFAISSVYEPGFSDTTVIATRVQ